MAENKKHRKWILIGGLGLIILCVISTIAAYLLLRGRDMNSRPLVLIHKPLNHAVVGEGEVVTLHATARLENGVKSMQFWVDDQLIVEKQTDDPDLTNMTHVDVWHAMQSGEHVIIARAVSKGCIEGQASITIEVTAASSQGVTHTVEEGETLESIAADYGVSPDALADANPGLGEEGDDLVIPGGESSEEPPGALESDDPPPTAEDDPPGSADSMADTLGLDLSDFFGGSRDISPVGLRLDLLELTADAYEELHCYVGMGLSPSRWYPDLDSNQSTDESFVLIGERSWDVDPHFTYESAPVIFWPQNEPLNARVECVGITGGGTDALELGVWEESIPPERWTGITLTGDASGADGSFSIRYRIERVGITEDVIPMYLDRDMAAPTNARLDVDARRLRWDYEPPDDEEEEPISGFRIYLNNNLQWIEPPDSRASIMPYEWFHPPCGSRYIFSVTAFRYGIPDGPESLSAITSVHTPEEGCHREIEISFLTLETFDLGGDGDAGAFSGDVGPVYGDFIANESSISFSGGSLGAGLDRPAGFEHNTLYDLFVMWRSGWWGFSGSPTLTVDVPPGGAFEFGFIINDRDSGSDDVLCDGFMSHEDVYGYLDEVHEDFIRSSNGRCILVVRYGPASGSPVGTGVVGEEPLPWLDITALNIIEATGQVQIHLLNSGTADWPGRDLQIELQTREGESLGIYTWTEFILETGESTFVSQPSMTVGAPFDVCALIDPHDLVPEYGETHNTHTPYCPELPDLSIAGIAYDPVGDELRVMVENLGGALENRSVELAVYLSGGSSAYLDATYTDTSFAPGEMRSMRMVGVSDDIRSALSDGYFAVIDGRDQIAESNESNNSLEVAARLLDVCWCDSFIPHYPPHHRGIGSSARMWFTVEILSADSSRIVATRERSSTLRHNETYAYGYNHTWDQGHSDLFFSCGEEMPSLRILDDEVLRVSIEAEFLFGTRGDWDDIGAAYLLLTAEDFPWIPTSAEQCADNRHYRFYVRPTGSRYDHADWFTVLSVGQRVP